MNKKFIFALAMVVLLAGAGCSQSNTASVDNVPKVLSWVQLPIEPYIANYKRFGEYFEDRFKGYHVGDDIEVLSIDEEVGVYAIADGIVKSLVI